MSLDVTDAIALARDLLKTSGEFQAHDPVIAAEFADRAFEICDDLGIDRTLIGDRPADVAEQPLKDAAEAMPTPAAPGSGSVPASVDMTSDELDDDARQTSDQLRALLQQQARVLEHTRETEAVANRPKAAKRSFWPFGGRPGQQGFGALQSV